MFPAFLLKQSSSKSILQHPPSTSNKKILGKWNVKRNIPGKWRHDKFSTMTSRNFKMDASIKYCQIMSEWTRHVLRSLSERSIFFADWMYSLTNLTNISIHFQFCLCRLVAPLCYATNRHRQNWQANLKYMLESSTLKTQSKYCQTVAEWTRPIVDGHTIHHSPI